MARRKRIKLSLDLAECVALPRRTYVWQEGVGWLKRLRGMSRSGRANARCAYDGCESECPALRVFRHALQHVIESERLDGREVVAAVVLR